MMNSAALGEDLLRPKGFRTSVLTLLLSTLAINVLSLALPIMTLQIYDRILPNSGSGTLPVLIVGVCFAIFLETILRVSRSYILSWSGTAYEHSLSCKAINHILETDISRLGDYGTGEHLHRVGSIGKLKDFYNGYSLITISELIFVPMYLILIFYIVGNLVLAPLTVLLLFVAVTILLGNKLKECLSERDETDDKRYNFLIESLKGIHTIKSFSLEDRMSRHYEDLQNDSTLTNYKVTQSVSTTFNAGAIFSHIMIAAVIAIGALYALDGTITTGALIATVLLSGRMIQPIQRALALWTRYQDYLISRERVLEVFETPKQKTIQGDIKVPKIGSLQMKGVHFRYEDDAPWLLRDIDLNLNVGEVLLLSGNHGEGKTALLELISGIYSPREGSIMIDGQDISNFKPENLIGHVGYIEREGTIFHGTIRDNMTCFGRINVTDAQRIAALLQVDEDISKLPSGFDTILSGNGTDNVPPGLRQRISIVRTLASKPKIILFDNAEWALDRKGFHLMIKILKSLKVTSSIILVTNDIQIQQLATKHMKLIDGRLIDITRIKKSMAKSGD